MASRRGAREDKPMCTGFRHRKGVSGGFPAFRVLSLWLIAVFLNPPGVSPAQQAERPAEEAKAESLSRIDADYQRQRARLDRERIERLTRLADSQKGGEAELTLLEVFRFAVSADRYADAEPAADRVIRAGSTTREVEFLAQLVKIIAEADRGDYDGSMRDLKAYLTAACPPRPSRPRHGPAPSWRSVRRTSAASSRAAGSTSPARSVILSSIVPRTPRSATTSPATAGGSTSSADRHPPSRGPTRTVPPSGSTTSRARSSSSSSGRHGAPRASSGSRCWAAPSSCTRRTASRSWA